MQTKATVRYIAYSANWLKCEETEDTKVGKAVDAQELSYIIEWDKKIVWALWKNSRKILKIHLLCDSSVPLLDFYPEK